MREQCSKARPTRQGSVVPDSSSSYTYQLVDQLETDASGAADYDYALIPERTHIMSRLKHKGQGTWTDSAVPAMDGHFSSVPINDSEAVAQ